MERLNFRLDDFTRVQWAPGARSVWEPKFQEVSNLYQNIEIMLVIQGVKPSALIVVAPENLAGLHKQIGGSPFSAIVLGQQGRNGQSYAATTTAYIPGQPFDYRVAITKPNLIDSWIDAWETHNDHLMGVLLGYPECCRKFFMKYWVEQNFIDTMWFQTLGTGVTDSENVIDVTPDPYCNVTLRGLGLRWVSHLPCSFQCEETNAIGSATAKLIKSLYPSAYQTLSEALQWPVKWTALHGIAEITTPVCRIISRTDATTTKYVVRQHGAIYPEEGSRGLDFPFVETPRKVKLVRKDTWTANGFSSYESMTEAHNVVLTAAGDLTGKSVIDLGCGNGELLRKIKRFTSDVHGVDSNVASIEEAARIANVRRMNIFNLLVFDRDFDVALISVQRLEEVDDSIEFIKRLRKHTRAVVYYSYTQETSGWEYVETANRVNYGPYTAIKVEHHD